MHYGRVSNFLISVMVTYPEGLKIFYFAVPLVLRINYRINSHKFCVMLCYIMNSSLLYTDNAKYLIEIAKILNAVHETSFFL